jgi:hypothetical protein
MLHQVEIVIRIDVGELASKHEAITVADENGFDFGKIFGLHKFQVSSFKSQTRARLRIRTSLDFDI